MSDADDLLNLSPAEARVLGCLIEKKETTPDVYPLSVNSLLSAANQKTSREPVMSLETSDIHRALKQLEQKGLVRPMFASRVERYEHLAAQRFSLTTQQIVLLGLLLLRGPQTGHELMARSERMARFGSFEDVGEALDLMVGRRPPLVCQLGRAPGQREERYVHLLSGEPPVETSARPLASAVVSEPEERLSALEEEVASLRARIDRLEGR